MRHSWGIFFQHFIPAFKKGFVEIRISWKRLTLRVMAEDFIAIGSRIGFVVVPALVLGVAFVLLPQGLDTLLLVAEQLSVFQPSPLIFLLLALAVWSVISEFSVRYAIYISDNSGKNLNDARVYWRKTVQKILAAVFLMWPSFIVLCGFIYRFFSSSYMPLGMRLGCFGSCIVLVYLLMSVLSNIYFRKSGAASAGKYKRTWLGERSLPNEEQQYLRKLYGIYSEYIYSLPKPYSFKQPYKRRLAAFTNMFKKANADFANGFPQNAQVLIDNHRVPNAFVLNNEGKVFNGQGELYKWRYQIPASFFAGLHRQIKWFFGMSVLIFALVCTLSAQAPIFGWIGAPALICLAFACYTGLYIGFLYIDKSYKRKWLLSARFLLLIWLAGCSWFNADHPVRTLNEPAQERPMLVQNFERWFATYKQGIDHQQGGRAQQRYPVFFICAEGGALRTGAYSSLFLTGLESKFAARGLDFKGALFGMSGVSGGALGLGVYKAIAFQNKDKHNLSDHGQAAARRFFEYDALSPVTGKMLFGDFLSLFIPWPVSYFDRAAALEQSWEKAYEQVKGSGQNVFEQNFLYQRAGAVAPMLIINTTEIETGLQCWITDLKPDSLAFGRDILSHKVRSLRYSTAINFSTRFPLFSPAARMGGAD